MHGNIRGIDPDARLPRVHNFHVRMYLCDRYCQRWTVIDNSVFAE
jgi:hypothetical protein